MSLLIKALQKAEQGKNAEAGTSGTATELSLEPLAPPAAPATIKPEPANTPQAAATLLAAKNATATGGTSRRLLWLSGLGLILLLGAGTGLFAYLSSLKQPELVLARRPPPAPPPETVPPSLPAAAPAAIENKEEPVKDEPVVAKEQAKLKLSGKDEPVFAELPAKPAAKPAVQPKPRQSSASEPLMATESSSVKVTRNNPVNAINPQLQAAYDAFNAGDDAGAQKQYRQVLQADVRNVDALLGMAAIAARQGRNEDALGWYGKVLEVEPKNGTALAASVSLQGQADSVATESRIKNLLAQEPGAANLHAALGNLYADQGQWPAAQQAYFQAYRYEPGNPDNAFNLAVSLDHLGKAALALQYYRQARELLSRSSSASIDRTQLESRIRQLQ